MNPVTRVLSAAGRFHYQWIASDIDMLQDTCTSLRGIGMAGSPAFNSVVGTINVHRRELGRVARRLHAQGVAPAEYSMSRLEAALWAVALAMLIGWALAVTFGPTP